MIALFKDRNWLYQKYILDGYSACDIAKLCEASFSEIYYWLDKLDIKVRTRGEAQSLHYQKNPEFKRGKNNPKWRGGRRLSGDGYVRIYRPSHPYATQEGYVLEHRLIMEKCLGRFLKPNEIAHHINGIKDDNRIENLQLMGIISHRKFHINKRERDKNGRFMPRADFSALKALAGEIK